MPIPYRFFQLGDLLGCQLKLRQGKRLDRGHNEVSILLVINPASSQILINLIDEHPDFAVIDWPLEMVDGPASVHEDAGRNYHYLETLRHLCSLGGLVCVQL